MFGIGFHQPDLFVITASQFQVINRLLINVKHRGSGAILGRHIGNRGAIAQRQAGRAFAVEFQVRRDHFLLTQKLGQGQDQVSSRNAGLQLPGQFNTDNVGQTHPGRATQHYTLSL